MMLVTKKAGSWRFGRNLYISAVEVVEDTHALGSGS